MQEVSWDPAGDFSYIIHLTGYTFGVTTNAETHQDLEGRGRFRRAKIPAR